MKKRSKNPKPAEQAMPCPCVSCTYSREILQVADARKMTALETGSACATAIVLLCVASPDSEEALESFMDTMRSMHAHAAENGERRDRASSKSEGGGDTLH